MFKIGDTVKILDIRKNSSWYIEGIFTVIDTQSHNISGQIVRLNVKFYDGDNNIHSTHLELVNNRKSRIEKLFNEENSTK